MEIALITRTQYDRLMELQKSQPLLTYEAKGWDTFDKSKMTEDDKSAVEEITSILKDHVLGFSSFTNFVKSKRRQGKMGIRLQYQYNYSEAIRYGGKIVGCNKKDSPSFVGVGYVGIDELLNGFDEQSPGFKK